MLRRAREASGLHIAALAVSMKVPVKKLEALEADRFDLLPDAVFVRALAASVCRALKLDTTAVLEKLPPGGAPRLLPEERGINTPFRTAGFPSRASFPEFLSKPTALAVLAIVFAACVVAMYPEAKLDESPQRPGLVESPAVSIPESVETAMPKPQTMQVESLSSTAPQLGPSATASVSVVGSPGTYDAKEPAPNATASLVTFRARGAVWVQVTEATGVVLLNKTLAVGEVLSVPGKSPVSVIVGRADVTDVEVRGSPFVLSGIAKDNVARFEVK
jgi:cytoskeleton protein RodZ